MSGSGSEKLPARMEDLERQVAIYAKAAADIQTCQDIGEVKRGAMIGEALRKLAKAIKASAKTQNSLTVSTAWHKRREGELLAAMDKQHGARGVGKKVDSHDVGPLSALGISWNESRRSQDVAAVPIEEFHEWAEKAGPATAPCGSQSHLSCTSHTYERCIYVYPVPSRGPHQPPSIRPGSYQRC